MVLNQKLININSLDISYVENNSNILNFSNKKKLIRALKEINFEVHNREIIGLIGKNGAGKSTLLKSIAGMIKPTKGRIEISGRVILLSGTDPGFFPDLSGRRNIRELGRAYGVSKEDIPNLEKKVIEFAQLGEAIDRNFRGYSTGMRGKLGFGFITSLNPDILLIDETLGVGDLEFRARAKESLIGIIQRSKIVIISTHSLGLAKEICTRGILLDKGEVFFDGDMSDSIEKYIQISK